MTVAAKFKAAKVQPDQPQWVQDLAIADGAAWAQEARAKAKSALLSEGLPTRRDEYWRYTDPTTLTQQPALPAALLDYDEAQLFGDVDRIKICFVDGVLDASASDDFKEAGVEIETLEAATASDTHWVRGAFGVLEADCQIPVGRPMATLNSVVATQGVVIRAVKPVKLPVSLIYLHQDPHSDAFIHHVVRVDAGASLTILENGPIAARSNTLMEIEVCSGASFHHVRAQGRDHERRATSHIFARIADKSIFKSFTLTANGRLTRNEYVIDIDGAEASAHVAGAAVGDGDFVQDDTVFVTHNDVDCESRQVFKKVLRNGAKGIFQGKILVKEGAQKTDGYQISQGLMLDDDSQFLAKPELEIYADDVQCSHGSTCGEVNEEALFYLTSRGVPKRQAQDMLVLAFLAQAIDEIDDDKLADQISDRLAGWLERRAG